MVTLDAPTQQSSHSAWWGTATPFLLQARGLGSLGRRWPALARGPRGGAITPSCRVLSCPLPLELSPLPGFPRGFLSSWAAA